MQTQTQSNPPLPSQADRNLVAPEIPAEAAVAMPESAPKPTGLCWPTPTSGVRAAPKAPNFFGVVFFYTGTHGTIRFVLCFVSVRTPACCLSRSSQLNICQFKSTRLPWAKRRSPFMFYGPAGGLGVCPNVGSG